MITWTMSSRAASAAALLFASQPGQTQTPTQAADTSNLTQASEEIVVTAQKRTESVQDVPISISVVSGDALIKQGASSLVDYNGYVPGLQVTSGGSPGQATVTLRGIATLNSNQTVGVYVDDAPVGSSGIWARSGLFSLDLLPYDIQRIEVLRGPQGTLYGASSIGGLLKYVTVTPSLSTFSVRGGVEAFSIDRASNAGWAGQVMANAPVVEGKLGLTASFAWRKTPGYIDDVSVPLREQNDYDQRGGRVSLLFKPADALSIRLGGIWQNVKSDGNTTIAGDVATGKRVGNGWSNNNFTDEPFTKTFHYYSATVDYDFGFATATSATSYSTARTRQRQDATIALLPALGPGFITPFQLGLNLKKWTQEVRLTSVSGGTFEWMVGGFFTDERSQNFQDIDSFLAADGSSQGSLAHIELPTKYKELAFFANGTWRPSDWFNLSGGIRCARNKQRFNPVINGDFVNADARPGRSRESVVTYSVSPEFHLSKDAMIYGRVATGYRPGGPNILFPAVPPELGSDRLTNYEVGVKADLLDRRLSFDVAAFYMDWSDIQVAGQIGTTSYGTNAGSAVSKGIEGSVTLRAAAGLTLSATASYTDAKLTEDTPALVGGLDGDRLPYAPKFSGSLSANYDFAISDGARATVGAGVRRTGRRWSMVQSNPTAVPVGAYTLVDANAAVTFAGRWTLRAYARNLLNTYGENSRQVITDELSSPAYLAIVPVQPRTIGVALDFAF